MTDFKSQLSNEMDRRGLKEKSPENQTSQEKAEKNKKKKKGKKPFHFSFLSFFLAFFLGALLLAGLVFFLWLKSDETAQKLQAKLPTKTAIVNRAVDPLITTDDVQPVLRMQPVNGEEETEEKSIESKEAQKPDTATAMIAGGMILAPVPGLYESSNYGPLPIINKEDGSTAFEVYKKPFDGVKGTPSIAFIISEMGINDAQTNKLIQDLPDNISFAFSPYTSNTKNFVMAARQDGHEAWLTLPLQTKGYPLQDPGPLAILTNADAAQNKERLNAVMGKAVGYAGFITEKDHVFRRGDAKTNQSFSNIFERGLAIIDSNDKAINFIEPLAKQKGYYYGQNNFWLDDNLTPLALNQKLRQALEFSRNAGGAIVMLRPYPASIETLNKFLNSVAAQEYNIVPASALIKAE